MNNIYQSAKFYWNWSRTFRLIHCTQQICTKTQRICQV